MDSSLVAVPPVRGLMARLIRLRRWPWLLLGIIGLYVGSFFLPVVTTEDGDRVLGWQLCVAWLDGSILFPLYVLLPNIPTACCLVCIALRRWPAAMGFSAIGVAGVLWATAPIICYAVGLLTELESGYYAWAGSIILSAVASWGRWR